MPEKIHYRLEGRVAHLVMDDGKANTMNLEYFQELSAAILRAEQEARGILIEGRPRFFSAGLDLKHLMAYTDAQRRQVIKGFADVCMKQLYLSPLPVVACVEGHAMAGGAVLLLCCDKKIGAEGSYNVGLNEVRVGINMPAFLLPLERATLPPQSHTDVILMGKVFDPAGAVTAGILDELAPATAAKDRALEVLKDMMSLPPQAYGATKQDLHSQVLRELLHQDIEEVITQTLTSGIFQGKKVE